MEELALLLEETPDTAIDTEEMAALAAAWAVGGAEQALAFRLEMEEQTAPMAVRMALLLEA